MEVYYLKSILSWYYRLISPGFHTWAILIFKFSHQWYADEVPFAGQALQYYRDQTVTWIHSVGCKRAKQSINAFDITPTIDPNRLKKSLLFYKLCRLEIAAKNNTSPSSRHKILNALRLLVNSEVQIVLIGSIVCKKRQKKEKSSTNLVEVRE